RLREPRDELWEAGAAVLGLGGPRDGAKLADHARAWLVKGFFLVFMLAILPGAVVGATSQPWDQLMGDPARLALWAIALMFTFDVCFGTVGYFCAVRALGTQIRTANPYLTGWVAAMICYPPFVLMGAGGPINYTAATRGWTHWMAGDEPLILVWGVLLTALAGAYAWSTVIFGLRFSNLTHRGIITNGPYRWFRHPAYLSKNLFWWLSTLPFLVTDGGPAQAARNCGLLLVVNAVYWWRGRTEERHLLADPVYRDYRAWTEAHGLIPRARRALLGALPGRLRPAAPERF
ncbi:MAG: protein-S-isoprenylcysteine O-methyltransferase, partial [Pseudomonadota bacterium]|nr:protein-S-isoprenylcysteine O-methyltransferase [Pseudomonadota bacterium]